MIMLALAVYTACLAAAAAALAALASALALADSPTIASASFAMEAASALAAIACPEENIEHRVRRRANNVHFENPSFSLFLSLSFTNFNFNY
jgi:hypothetical protein